MSTRQLSSTESFVALTEPTVRLTRLTVPRDDVEIAADRLWCAGAGAVEEQDLSDGRIELNTVLAEHDHVSIQRLGPLDEAWSVEFVSAPSTPSSGWREYARPIAVSDRLTIQPAWILDRPTDQRHLDDDGAQTHPLRVMIEPGAAFGLGDHPTTRLTAGLLDEMDLVGARVLDVGCGTGVLAVLAKLRGAHEVVALDIAEAAVDATRRNAALNSVAVDVSSRRLDQVDGTFDIVVANILAPTLVELATDLLRVTSGTLIISGVLASAHDHVLAALAPLRVTTTRAMDGWVAVQLSPHR